jgi:pimeloyl-ACP methyl ester carboxylesterase
LARLLLECLEGLDVEDATVVANDTAGGLLLLALASGHPGLGRVGRLVLTNCDNYGQFPPDALKRTAAMCRAAPGLASALLPLALRFSAYRRRTISSVAAAGLDQERVESFFGPMRRDRRVAADLVAAMAGCHPDLLLDAARAIPQFDRPVLLIWGEACDFFPLADAKHLASDFPSATLRSVPGAKTWVPTDNPAAVADALVEFVPAPAPDRGR